MSISVRLPMIAAIVSCLMSRGLVADDPPADSKVAALAATAADDIRSTVPLRVLQRTRTSGTRQFRERIRPRDMKPVGDKAFRAKLRSGRPGDKDGVSECVLLEDGKPLQYPHSRHGDVGSLGDGRYSHWTESSIRFSTSDSSDPRSNARRYELVSDEAYSHKSAKVTATSPFSAFRMDTDQDVRVRMLRITFQNLDKRLSVVPWLKHREDPDLTSVPSILQSVLRQGMTDQQKAIAVWKFLVDWRYHDYPAENGPEFHDPIKLLNVYGYGFCDDSAQVFCGLGSSAGLKTRVHALNGHVVAEAFFDNAWHMFDPDHKVVYYTASGDIASVAELGQHPEIITATPTDPLGANSVDIARLYTTVSDNRSFPADLPMSRPLQMLLGPNDQATLDFTRSDLVHRRQDFENPLPSHFANGTLVQTRKLDDLSRDGEKRLFEFRWPYVVLGGTVVLPDDAKASGLDVEISRDQDRWSKLNMELRDDKRSADLNRWIDAQPSATYGFWLRLGWKEDNRRPQITDRIELQTIFQFAPKAHAPVRVGANHFELSVGTIDGQPLKDWAGLAVEMEWEETAASSLVDR